MSVTAERQEVRPFVAATASMDLYRLILLRKNGSELLVAGSQPFFTLPSVKIPRWTRLAESLTAVVRKQYGISAFCLFAPDLPAAAPDCNQPLYEVMETRESTDAAPSDTYWLPVDSFADRTLADRAEDFATTNALRQVREFQGAKAYAPFGKVGWIEDLLSWVRREIEPYGLRLTGQVRQLNAGPAFALLRLETNRSAVWFKAVGEPNLREFSISLALSNLFSGFVPTILATRPAWNGWLTMEFVGSSLDEVQDVRAWERAAETLARLQIASLGTTEQFFKAKCRDLRVSTLLPLVDPFTEAMSRLMEEQQKTPPPILSREQLQALGRRIKDVLSAWAQLNVPDTLGHLDLNPGNILCAADQCVLLDWAEGYVGPPFLTLEYLRQHLRRLRPEDVCLDNVIAKVYEAKWRNSLSPETVCAAQDFAPVLAVFSYAAATMAWRDAALPKKVAAYLRSLTRRIHHEMQRLQERSRACCN